MDRISTGWRPRWSVVMVCALLGVAGCKKRSTAPDTCGNGVVDPGEICDGDCPTECTDAPACHDVSLVGSAAACTAECVATPVTACAGGDGCCGLGCDESTDADCHTTTIGPIRTAGGSHPMVAFYVVSDGLVSARLTVERDSDSKDQRVLTRVLDPDERLRYWQVHERLVGDATELVTASDVEPLPDTLLLDATGVHQIRLMTGLNSRITLHLTGSAAVGYGVSMQNGQLKHWEDQPDVMYAWAPVHRSRATQLELHPYEDTDLPTFHDETTDQPLSTDGLVVPPHDTREGHLWRVTLPTTTNWRFYAAGFPFILCDTVETAETIHASVERIPEGPLAGGLVSHRFQLEMAALLPEVLARTGDADALYAAPGANYPATQPDCVDPADPDDTFRHMSLIDHGGCFTATKWALGRTGDGQPHQVVDPQSTWAGAVGLHLYEDQTCDRDADCLNGGPCTAGSCGPFDEAADRWDVLHRASYNVTDNLASFYGGPSLLTWHLAYSMALAAVTHHPCNPWGPTTAGGTLTTPELLARVVALSFLDLLFLSESDTWPMNGLNTYPGSASFAVGGKNTPGYGLAAPYLAQAWPEEVDSTPLGERLHRLWAQGMRHLIDRYYPDYIVSSRNQSAHLLAAFQHFYQGSQGLALAPGYGDLARRWAARFVDSQHPSGFFPESLGPDASYSGITHWYMGAYYQLTTHDAAGPDTYLLDSLQRSYQLFNHTVTPEPAGDVTGSINFSHRIGFAFELQQYGGAKVSGDALPEVAYWSERSYSDYAAQAQSLAARAGEFDEHAEADYVFGRYPIHFLAFDADSRATPAPLPASEPGPFIRNFSDELIAVRRPGYYAAVYVGQPAPTPFYVGSDWPTTRLPIPDEDAPPSGTYPNTNTVDLYVASPMQGGGLSNFWVPDYGTAVLATNWSPVTHHGLMAVFPAWNEDAGAVIDQRFWEDYWSTGFALDEVAQTLVVSGALESGDATEPPLTYARSYLFDDQSLSVTVELTGGSVVFDPATLVEVLPLTTCTRPDCTDAPRNRKALGATIVDGSGNPVEGSLVTDLLRVVDSLGNGVTVQLDQARPLRVAPHGLRYTYWNTEVQVGRVEVDLTPPLAAGEVRSLSYTLSPYP